MVRKTEVMRWTKVNEINFADLAYDQWTLAEPRQRKKITFMTPSRATRDYGGE